MPPIGSTWKLNSWLDTAWAAFTWADVVPPEPIRSTNVSFMMGVPIAIAQTTAYALPARICRVTATAPVEFSVDNSTWGAPVAATTTVGEQISAMFLRCTSSTTCVVVVKAA